MTEEQTEKPPQPSELKIDKKQAQEWLSEKWTAPTVCPISGDNNWAIADDFVQPMRYTGGGLTIGGPGYPVVMVICATCGYTLLFNAVVMGLLGDSSGSE